MMTLTNVHDEQLFTDLTSPQAEVVKGGYETSDPLNVYKHANFGTWLGSFTEGSRRLSPTATNQISSVKIKQGLWKFYDLNFHIDLPFVRDTITLGRGPHANLGIYGFNDKISSIERIG
jgi:hypothetical protein